jgi:predicted DNA-binding protein (MmcQ/YjbR family)
MDNIQAKRYLLNKTETIEYTPFGPDVSVFKVKHKMYATLSLGKGNEKGTNGKMAGHYCINLKCDPEEAVMLRDVFAGSIPQGEVERMIDNSYMLVVSKMPKQDQQSLLMPL